MTSVRQRKGTAALIALLAAAAVVAAIIFWPAKANAAGDSGPEIEATTLVKVGDRVPDFAVETLEGKKISVRDLRGQTVLVNFWATWCPPCRAELPKVQSDIVEGMPSVKVLAISRGEERAKVEKFVKDKGYGFTVCLDPSQEVYGKFATNYIPRNFVVGPDGIVTYVGVGYDEKEFGELKNALKKTLKH